MTNFANGVEFKNDIGIPYHYKIYWHTDILPDIETKS